MSTKVRYASAIAVAVTFITTLLSAAGSGASAQSYEPAVIQQPTVQFTSQPVTQPLPVVEQAVDSTADTDAVAPSHASDPGEPDDLSREMQCLAGAIYFEAKGESLEGQLAVGRVIVARSKSGRFPASYCGVVYQRSQFSFIRGNRMPAIDKSSRNWANAVRMARAAHQGSMTSPAEGALFFHAAYASPNWRLKRVARIDNHIFYR